MTVFQCARALAAAVVLATSTVTADPRPDAHPGPAVDPRADIARRFEVSAESVRASAVPGFFEVADAGEILYVSADGKYAFAGDLYETAHNKNLTEQRRGEIRLAALKAVPDDATIVFSPKMVRYTVTVFTDVDCSYCRQLHSQIAEYNRLGVRVRYLFYPRSGPGTDSWRKAVDVWCAPDRKEALTHAKLGARVASTKGCDGSAVERSYRLGKELGMRGTPGIFTERGDYLPGYYAPAELVEQLKALESAATGG